MTEAHAPAVVWLRQDLRLSDNPALRAAVDSKRPLLIVYLLDDETPGRWRVGGASRWWLHRSLKALSGDIEKRGGRLLLRRGNAAREIPKLVAESGATAIYWNRCYEPYALARDKALKDTLKRCGVEVHSFNGALLLEPWEIKTKTGEPYKVFTPFWRACLSAGAWRPALSAPRKLSSASAALPSERLEDWRLQPTRPNWAKTFETEWTPGETGAQKALERFLEERLGAYPSARDQMGERGTSRLSSHLHYGEISPAQIARALDVNAHAAAGQRGTEKFLAELGWREFSNHLLFHWPALPDSNWRDQFDAFAWRDDEAALEAWRRGGTGYPIVDAAMRELWATGYMHNRARMVAASFLIKHLLIDWRRGEDWFWDTLVDADLANNAASWQWVAGSGAGASPYFRIFNPVAQGRRYDASGAYVRRWVPELSKLPDEAIHAPWEADSATLQAAGIDLGATYPHPLVDHAAARARALAAYAALSSDR